MIIPWRVDVPQDRWPVVNWLIIAGAIAIFVGQTILFFFMCDASFRRPDQSRVVEADEIAEIIKPFVLEGFSLNGLVGHMWLHGGIIHLLGNLLFLWIFGNAVCAKIGNVFYLPIYLLLGVSAGLAHLFFQGGPVVGASGAINGVVGMYLVFFPQNEISCLFIFFIPLMIRPIVKTFFVSSYWMILLWLAFDIWGAARGGGRIAYFAHLGGFATGFMLAVLMLKAKWVTMERYEKSLLQILFERHKPVVDEFKPSYGGILGPIGDEIENKIPPVVPGAYQQPAKEVEPETIPLEPEEPKERYIRFACSCGRAFEVPPKFAGRMGKCPGCKKRIPIPNR